MEKSAHQAQRRKRGLDLYAEGLLSRNELIGGLLDTFEIGCVTEEFAADPPEVQRQIRTFVSEYWPSPLPRVFLFGDASDEDLAEIDRVRQGKYAELAIAIGLVPRHLRN
jgi:hypothetical protein